MTASQPPWAHAFWIWPTHAGEARPWREDRRLRDRFTESGFPDDIQVVFQISDSAHGSRGEVMWVTIIAHDPEADQFLGILLNQPDELRSVVQFDNVAFRWEGKRGLPVAIDVMGSYAAGGWPLGALEDSLRSALIRGVRAYRAGSNGHNVPAVERCIATLDSVDNQGWPGATLDERLLLHFVHGRCLAQRYETLRAIQQFRRAAEVAPESLDTHMALLAEYSVIVHKPQAQLSEGTEARWEQAYLAQLALVREKFGTNAEVMGILDWVFDERNAGDLSALTPEQLARRRRIGFAIIRWEQR